MVVDPADKLLIAVEEQLTVCEEVSSVTTQEAESVCDPLHSSSFFEEPPFHSSSFVDESPSQSLSLTEELSVSVGDPTADSVVQPSPSTTADSVTQPSPSTESSTFNCVCTCILKGKLCSTLFSPEYYQTMRDSSAELMKNDLDNIIKGQIMAFISIDDMTRCRSRHSSKEQERVRGTYYHQGHKICWQIFAHLHGIGKTHIPYT